MTGQEAIKNLTAYMYYALDDMPQDVGSAISLAIAAIREQDARAKGCKHCKGGLTINCNEPGDYCSVEGGVLEFDNSNDEYGTGKAEINFCPMCGRNLTPHDTERDKTKGEQG